MATRNTEGGGARGGKTGGGQSGAAAGQGGAGGAGGAGKDASGAGTTGARGGGAGRGASAGKKSASSRKPSGTGSSRAGSKSAASRGGSKTAGTAGTKKATGSRGTQKLRSDLRGFVQAHPGGWGHNEWIGLVNLLRERGHDTSDTDAIGMALERERLTLVLERVPGLGAQRVKAIADKYPRIWNVMQAGAEELAMVANIPKAVAKKVKDALP